MKILCMGGGDIWNLLRIQYGHHPFYIKERHNFLNNCCDADLVVVTMSGQIYEFEIKKTRPDFLRDKKKLRARIYSGKIPGKIPNRFYYVTDGDFIKDNEIPKYSGLLVVKDGMLYEKKRAPKFYKELHSLKEYLKLANSLRNKYDNFSKG